MRLFGRQIEAEQAYVDTPTTHCLKTKHKKSLLQNDILAAVHRQISQYTRSLYQNPASAAHTCTAGAGDVVTDESLPADSPQRERVV